MHDATAGGLASGQAGPALVSRTRLLLAGFRAHWLFFAITAAYVAAGAWALKDIPGALKLDFADFAGSFVLVLLPTLVLAIVTLRFLRLAIVDRPERPAIAFYHDLKTFFCAPGRLANGLPMVLAMTLFVHCFAVIKANIPNLVPFGWDERFMEWDRWLHFGLHPYEILQPLLGYPVVTFAVNVVYNLWFIVMWTVWCWLAFSERNSALRLQFFIAFMLSWSFGGSLAAILLSSAGPCYYALLGHAPDPFAPLMAYLNGVGETYPLWALNVQQMLWDGYTGVSAESLGISAMPSMHNAAALLFAFVGWRTGRAAGIALTAFCVLILLGSVHLGWHYAIDGYAGFVIAWAAWLVAGRIAPWYLNRPAMKAYNEALDAANGASPVR